MSDPLTDIENEKAMFDLGMAGHRIYTGARSNGASRVEAFLVTLAFFRSLGLSNTDGLDG